MSEAESTSPKCSHNESPPVLQDKTPRTWMPHPVSRRTFLRAGATLGLSAAVFGAFPGCARDRKRPNVLWIVVDTARAANFSCYGYPRETSPVIDALARRGVRYGNAYSQAFWTAPSVSCYMTGRYFPNWVVSSTDKAASTVLHPDAAELLAPAVFAEAQYDTAMFSCHRGYVTARSRLGRAFHTAEMVEEKPWPKLGGRLGTVEGNTFQELNATAFPWFEARDRNKPFFAYLHAMDTHAPYVIPDSAPFNQWTNEDYDGLYVRDFNVSFSSNTKKRVRPVDRDQLTGLYDGCIRHADDHVGRLFEHLERLDLLENTIVVFTSDHGEALLDDLETHGHSQNPGHAGAEETCHVPLIIAGPGMPEGLEATRTVESIDILPTLMEACGIEAKGEMDGRVLSEVFGRKGSNEERWALTKAWYHDVPNVRRPQEKGIERLFLRHPEANHERWRFAPKNDVVWRCPDRMAQREPLPDGDSQAWRERGNAYFGKVLLPPENRAIARKITYATTIYCDTNSLRYGIDTNNWTHHDGPVEEESEAFNGKWVVEKFSGDHECFYAKASPALKPLDLEVLRVPAASYRAYAYVYVPANAQGALLRYRFYQGRWRVYAPGKTDTPGWHWVPLAPLKPPTHKIQVSLMPAAGVLRIRRLLFVSDTGGAFDDALAFFGDPETASGEADDSLKALENLGYL